MTRKFKWLSLSVLLTSGTLFMPGCVGPFWQGLWEGWPGNPMLNLLLDIAKETTIYRT